MWADIFAVMAVIIVVLRAILWEDKNMRWVWLNLVSALFMVAAWYSALFIAPLTATTAGTFGSTTFNAVTTITQNYVTVNSQGFIFYSAIVLFWVILCSLLAVKDFLEVKNIASMRTGMIE